MAVIMTNEEAIKELQESLDMIRDYVVDESESRLMTALEMAIKALEQEPIILKVNEKQLEELIHDNPLCVAMAEPKTDVLDKIRAEIETEKVGYPPSADYYKAIMKALQIIDKYRQEG